jgi:hypothetical protein
MSAAVEVPAQNGFRVWARHAGFGVEANSGVSVAVSVALDRCRIF